MRREAAVAAAAVRGTATAAEEAALKKDAATAAAAVRGTATADYDAMARESAAAAAAGLQVTDPPRASTPFLYLFRMRHPPLVARP